MAPETEQNVRQYLQGTDYPASKDELFSAAESNGAPHGFFKRLAELPTREYSDHEDVAEALDGLRRSDLRPDS
ncbi:MAG: DUF2795 domain-containing protein [Actinomycetota bacterium]|nr:DUF2795 domain-containing protein [Actinomycetota bacterium]